MLMISLSLFSLFSFVLKVETAVGGLEDQWQLMYENNDRFCEGVAFWQMRVSLPNGTSCVPKDCNIGPWGPNRIVCETPDLSGTCRIIKYDNSTDGRVCNSNHHFADGYAVPNMCIDQKKIGLTFCAWKHSSNTPDHLQFACYEDDNCSKGESILSDYVQNQCVIDYFNDPDVFSECDDLSEEWVLLYNDTKCQSQPVRVLRNEISGKCEESDCQEGPCGAQRVVCTDPQIPGLCKIKRYEPNSVSGRQCNERNYLGDVLLVPSLCVSYKELGNRWCNWKHESATHLLFKCYDDDMCSKNEILVGNYLLEECVIDSEGEPIVFDSCDDSNEVQMVFTSYYTDAKCTRPYLTQKVKAYGACEENPKCKPLGSYGLYVKTGCSEPNSHERRCHLRYYERETHKGKRCDESQYFADGYFAPNVCVDFRDSLLNGWCKMQEGKNNLKRVCYDEAECKGKGRVVTDFVKNRCVISSFEDPEVFIECFDHNNEYLIMPHGEIVFFILWMFALVIIQVLFMLLFFCGLVILVPKMKKRKYVQIQ